MRICKNGEWKHVKVDDYVPCYPEAGEWWSLIESTAECSIIMLTRDDVDVSVVLSQALPSPALMAMNSVRCDCCCCCLLSEPRHCVVSSLARTTNSYIPVSSRPVLCSNINRGDTPGESMCETLWWILLTQRRMGLRSTHGSHRCVLCVVC